MSREVQILLSTNDPAALCMVFVNGRVAEMAAGEASVLVRGGQRVRWFVRPSRRKATLRVIEIRGSIRSTLFHDVCDPVVESGLHLVEGRQRSPSTRAASGAPSALAPAPGP